jgi:hypothetical protein
MLDRLLGYGYGSELVEQADLLSELAPDDEHSMLSRLLLRQQCEHWVHRFHLLRMMELLWPKVKCEKTALAEPMGSPLHKI